MRVAALDIRRMLLDREPSRRAGLEGHFGDRTRLHFRLDVVAVQVQHDRPVAWSSAA